MYYLKRLLAWAPRLSAVMRHLFAQVRLALPWLFRSREVTNYTYDLTELNYRYLAYFLSIVCGRSVSEMRGYMDELRDDTDLKKHIRSRTAGSRHRHFADDEIRFGRRLGWYAVVRANRPSLVVETGVDKGLGSCVICAALLKNREEGWPGKYLGTDINPHAGYLLAGVYSDVGSIAYGDSIESLIRLPDSIDVFINDSDHSIEYESKEYLAIADKLSEHAIVLGDNSHFSDKLVTFAENTGRNFLYFQEQPHKHWYPGAGIGAAYGQAHETARKQVDAGDHKDL